MRGSFLGVRKCKRLFRLSEDVKSDLMGCGVTFRSSFAKHGDVAWRAYWKKSETNCGYCTEKSYPEGVTNITFDITVVYNHQYLAGCQTTILFSLLMKFNQNSVPISSPYLSEIWSNHNV